MSSDLGLSSQNRRAVHKEWGAPLPYRRPNLRCAVRQDGGTRPPGIPGPPARHGGRNCTRARNRLRAAQCRRAGRTCSTGSCGKRSIPAGCTGPAQRCRAGNSRPETHPARTRGSCHARGNSPQHQISPARGWTASRCRDAGQIPLPRS